MEEGPILEKSISLLGIRIDDVPRARLVDLISGSGKLDGQAVFANINIYGLNLAFEQGWFRDFLNGCTLTFCDGFGVRFGAALAGKSLRNRNTPPDFIRSLGAQAAERDLAIFLLGARPGIAEGAATRLREEYPGLRVESHHGYFDKSSGCDENLAVVTEINRFRPHLLVVCFGMPLQEKWILENLSRLDVSVVMPAGALLDYLAGAIRRPPPRMTDHGLEWLGRLAIEPGRLWRRYILGNPLFFWRVFVHEVLRVPLPKQG